MRTTRKKQLVRHIIVCVSLTHASERDFLSGIFRYLDEGHNWKVQLIQNSPPFSDRLLHELEQREDVDGIIIADAHRRDMIPAFVNTPIPIALISGVAFRTDHPLAKRRQPTVVIHNDNAGIGRLALRHFIECGKYNCYGFVPTERGVGWSDEREEAFVRAARASGFRAKVFRNEPGKLGAWLKALPKPAAIMAAYDELAASVLDACERESIAVPRQIAVLGVDNDLFICRYASTPLSSILPDHEGMGYRAAQGLDRLLRSRLKSSKHKHIALPPLKVVARASTGAVIPAAAIIDRAKEIIHNEATNGLTIEEVAKRLRVSRRLAELRFREIEGTSIGKAIARRKLEVATHLIKTTSMTLVRIAAECGFSDAKHLTHRFTAANGQSPRTYRKQEIGESPILHTRPKSRTSNGSCNALIA